MPLKQLPGIGDRIQRDGHSIVWTVIGFDLFKDEWILEYAVQPGMPCQDIVNTKDVYNKFTLITNKINPSMFQLELDSLINAFDNNTSTSSCVHDWKIYHGLNHSDEYCEKCDAKRELKS